MKQFLAESKVNFSCFFGPISTNYSNFQLNNIYLIIYYKRSGNLLNEVCDIPASNGNMLNAASYDIAFCYWYNMGHTIPRINDTACQIKLIQVMQK